VEQQSLASKAHWPTDIAELERQFMAEGSLAFSAPREASPCREDALTLPV
jgi:hypothetical protein